MPLGGLAALLGLDSCKARCFMLCRPQHARQHTSSRTGRHMARFGRHNSHDAASHLAALTECRRIMNVPPVLLRRRMDASTDQLGPVAARADHVVP